MGPRAATRTRLAPDRTEPDGDGDSPGGEPGRPRRPRRRLLIAAAAAAAVAVSGAAVVAVRSDDGGEPESATAPTTTAAVERRTLTQSERIEGTLDFGDTHGVAAGAAGTVTSVAADGTVVDRGGVLFTIDRQPTVLLVGAIPLYRELSQGVDDGPDVAQLEENLTALGYTDDGALVVDEDFDGSTTDAVEAWQEALGVEPTGAVTAALAVFLPGSLRIAGAALDVGAGAQEGATVVDTTSTTRVVQAQIETSQADLASPGDKVTVTLPDGTEVAGTVVTVAAGTASTESSSGAAGAGGLGAGTSAGATDATADSAVIDLVISLDDQAPAEGYTTASVDVALTGRVREDVLAVPVTALLSLTGGGYALEIPAGDGTTTLVAVEPGMYADGYVEVTGDGIDEGTDVVVAEP